MNEFKIAKKVLKEEENAQAQLLRDMKKKCDWDIPEDRAFHLSEERRKLRRKIINSLAPDRVCRYCKRKKIRQEEWIILRNESGERFACCRSCAVNARNLAETETIADALSSLEIFPAKEVRFRIDGLNIARARGFTGLTLESFSNLAGWSISWQRKLESSVITVNKETAQTILQVFKDIGYETADNLEALEKE